MKFSVELGKAAAAQINTMLGRQYNSIIANFYGSLYPELNQIFSGMDYSFIGFHIGLRCNPRAACCDLYVKFLKGQDSYILPYSMEFPLSNFIAPIASNKATPSSLRLRETDIKMRFMQLIPANLPLAKRFWKECAAGQHRELIQKVFPDERKPYEHSVKAKDLIEYYSRPYDMSIWGELAKKYSSKNNLTYRKIAWKNISYHILPQNKIEVTCVAMLLSNAFPAVKLGGQFQYAVPLSRTLEPVIADFEKKVEKCVDPLLQELWMSDTPDKLDINRCRSNSNDDELFRSITKMMRNYMDPHIKKINAKFTKARVNWKDGKDYIAQRGDTYYLFFDKDVFVPLAPKEAPLNKQHIADDYDPRKDPEHTAAPRHEGEWIRFAEYLAEQYEKRLRKENLLDYTMPVNMEFKGIRADVSIANGALSFSSMNGKIGGHIYTVSQLMEIIINSAIEWIKRMNMMLPNSYVTAAEAKLITYLKLHPKTSATELKKNVPLEDINSQSVLDFIRAFQNNYYISTQTARDVYGTYNVLSLNPLYKSIRFSDYVRPYNLNDIEYLILPLKISVLSKALEEMNPESWPDVLNALQHLTKKNIVNLFNDTIVQRKLDECTSDDIDFIKASLMQLHNGTQIVQEIFAERDIKQMEMLASESITDNTETIADMLLELDATTINAFFRRDIGAKYLENCQTEQLEILADALVCIDGCTLLKNKIQKQLNISE